MNLRDRLFGDHDDDLEDCGGPAFKENAIDPDNLPYHILFGDSVRYDGVVDEEAVLRKAAEYRELFNA